MKTDIEIAREAKKQPIMDIGAKLGIPSEHLLPYGHDKAKVSQAFLKSLEGKKEGKLIKVLDAKTGQYVESGKKADEIVVRMLKKDPAERIKLLRESTNPQAQFLWGVFRFCRSGKTALLRLADEALSRHPAPSRDHGAAAHPRHRLSVGSRTDLRDHRPLHDRGGL